MAASSTSRGSVRGGLLAVGIAAATAKLALGFDGAARAAMATLCALAVGTAIYFFVRAWRER